MNSNLVIGLLAFIIVVQIPRLIVDPHWDHTTIIALCVGFMCTEIRVKEQKRHIAFLKAKTKGL